MSTIGLRVHPFDVDAVVSLDMVSYSRYRGHIELRGILTFACCTSALQMQSGPANIRDTQARPFGSIRSEQASPHSEHRTANTPDLVFPTWQRGVIVHFHDYAGCV